MEMGMDKRVDPASFRDPAGFVYRGGDGTLYRQVHAAYLPHYEQLMSSGLYAELLRRGGLIEHEEADLSERCTDEAVRVLRPRALPFISYPYEWCFSQLKDAALLTLDTLQTAVRHGMILKDASAFNIAFDGPRPVFLDTLSFEQYMPGQPWVAYRQFCRHFLAPLALMAHVDSNLSALLRAWPEGIALPAAVRMLPHRAWWNFGLLLHLRGQAWFQERDERRQQGQAAPPKARPVSRNALEGLVDSLVRTVRKLRLRRGQSQWLDYYQSFSYSPDMKHEKDRIVAGYLRAVRPGAVWDLGANTGAYSAIAAGLGARVTAFELDPVCVDAMYCALRDGDGNAARILPLCMDLANPSPGLGWAHAERQSLLERGPADAVLALALVHHMAIGRNIPLPWLAECLARMGRHLIVEFVPKEDPQTRRLLETRRDIFAEYSREAFERSFARHFVVHEHAAIPGGGRIIYRMERREAAG